MKKIFTILIMLISTSYLYSQGLNSNATYIKTNFSTEYEQTLKKYAVNEWKNDFAMIVYEINRQSDSLFALIKEFKSENTNIVYNAIQEWSKEGYLSVNNKLFEEMKVFDLKNLIKFHCDWAMVKYEYDRQVKAKNSF